MYIFYPGIFLSAGDYSAPLDLTADKMYYTIRKTLREGKMEKGIIFDIQPFSLDDGPGIRSTVFLKGCPLSCIWCHNPEGQNPEPEIFYRGENCINCGSCAREYPECHIIENGKHIFLREKATDPEKNRKTAKNCPAGAFEITGREMSAGEIIAEVMSDETYYKNSGGGITLSGGEPLFQSEFALAILKTAKEKGLDTCVETSGYVKSDIFKESLKYLDRIYFDIKETDEEKHKKYTGAGLELIMQNLGTAAESGIDLTVRCPVIPGLNDRKEHFEKVAEIAKEYNIKKVELKKYHPLGLSKYKSLGREAEYTRDGFGEIDEKLPEMMKEISPETEFTV